MDNTSRNCPRSWLSSRWKWRSGRRGSSRWRRTTSSGAGPPQPFLSLPCARAQTGSGSGLPPPRACPRLQWPRPLSEWQTPAASEAVLPLPSLPQAGPGAGTRAGAAEWPPAAAGAAGRAGGAAPGHAARPLGGGEPAAQRHRPAAQPPGRHRPRAQLVLRSGHTCPAGNCPVCFCEAPPHQRDPGWPERGAHSPPPAPEASHPSPCFVGVFHFLLIILQFLF